MKKKILVLISSILVSLIIASTVVAGGALPGFTSAEQPIIGDIWDTDEAIMGSGPENMTVVVTYKNESGEVKTEANTDENGIFSVNIDGKLSAADKVKAYTVGLRTQECMADSTEIEKTVLPARITLKNLKKGSRKVTIKTYAKAKVRIKINKYAKTLKMDKKGKKVLYLSKKNKIKKGYKVKWTITYKGVKGPTQEKKIK